MGIMEKSTGRKSNFEALRLLCMLMVLSLHSFSGYNHGSGVWQALDFFRESASICAVDCFVLISGYFGIQWRFKSFFNLVFQIFFYSVGIYLVVVALGIVDWSLRDFIMRFACLITDSWGFAIAYVILYFCAPALNALAEKSTNRQLFIYLSVYFIAINFISVPRYAPFTYALVYLIGRFLRKINVAGISFTGFGKAYWITTILIFASVYFLIFKSLQILNPGRVNGWPIGFIGYDYAAPLVIAQAVFLFCFFAKLRINSKFVNWCAKSCFAIFLIHMHPAIKNIGYYGITESLYDYPVYLHILYLLGLIVFVFFGSILIDKVRIVISDGLYCVLEKLFAFIPDRWKRVESYIPSKLVKIIEKD